MERKSPLATWTAVRPLQSIPAVRNLWARCIPSFSAHPSLLPHPQYWNHAFLCAPYYTISGKKLFHIIFTHSARGVLTTRLFSSTQHCWDFMFLWSQVTSVGHTAFMLGGKKNHCILKCWLHQMATRLEDSNHAGLRRLKTRLENWSLLSLYRKKWIKKENNKEGCALILLCSR